MAPITGIVEIVGRGGMIPNRRAWIARCHDAACTAARAYPDVGELDKHLPMGMGRYVPACGDGFNDAHCAKRGPKERPSKSGFHGYRSSSHANSSRTLF